MNETQKQALKDFHPKLLHDLELNADLIGKFIHHGIFNEDMIEEFQSETTRRKEVQKMLLQLPRRGPRAFEKFIHALQDHYSWLAEGLREAHQKLLHRKDADMVTGREKVDIFVHEHFGNSKRLCEEDKKVIRKFLYRHLKQQDELQNQLDGMDNITQDDLKAVERNTEKRVCRKVLGFLNRESDSSESRVVRVDISDSEDTDSDSGSVDLDSMDGVGDRDSSKEVTIDMIENKVNEINTTVDNLKEEMQNCYNVLGLKNCEYSLVDVLKTYSYKRQSELAEFVSMKDKLESLEKKRNKLEQKLIDKECELNECIDKLADAEHVNERNHAMRKDLEAKCARLEQLHVKHVEKQQTLMTLKNMVNDLSPLQRQAQEHYRHGNGSGNGGVGGNIGVGKGVDEMDGYIGHNSNSNMATMDTLQLPKLHATKSEVRMSRNYGPPHPIRQSRTRLSSNHLELPKSVNKSGQPWK